MPLQILRQDITKMNCDAIVNTTNCDMIGYSGVDLAIHNCAGPLLDEECKKITPLELGFAKYTKGYNLNCKYIIHTSGPIWHGGTQGEKAILKSCYTESLNLAKKLNCESVAFPLISSGSYGYPKDQVLSFAVEVISDFLLENEMQVYLCVYDKTSYNFSKELFNDLLEFINEDIDFPTEKFTFNRTSRQLYSSNINPINEPRTTRKNQECAEDYNINSNLKDYLQSMDKNFMDTLFYYIDQKKMTDVECYKRANVDRKAFSKLKNNPAQKPSKQTAVAFAISLKLSLNETQHLLSTAGLTLSDSQVFDKIIKYFIIHKNYNIFKINEALFEFDQMLLGSV